MLKHFLFQEPSTPPTPGAAYACGWGEKELSPSFIHPLKIVQRSIYVSPTFPRRRRRSSMTPTLPTPEGTITPASSVGRSKASNSVSGSPTSNAGDSTVGSPASMASAGSQSSEAIASTGASAATDLSIPDHYFKELSAQVIIIYIYF